jgi:hypothetical protein
MKRFLFLVAFPLVLAGCGSADVRYQLSFDIYDKQAVDDLTLASTRVIERRLERLEATVKDQSIERSETGAVVSLSLTDATAANILTGELTQPFKLRVMKEAPAGQGDITVEGHGAFAETGITESHVVWGEAAEDAERKGAVRITFTPEGRAKLATLFQENNGKSIGIFIRDRLISKLMIKSDQIQDNIVIRDIPNPDLAKIFVDDLNVGLHVTFTPLP